MAKPLEEDVDEERLVADALEEDDGDEERLVADALEEEEAAAFFFASSAKICIIASMLLLSVMDGPAAEHTHTLINTQTHTQSPTDISAGRYYRPILGIFQCISICIYNGR